jgi:hypothetical protein
MVSLQRVNPSHRRSPNVVAKKDSLLMLSKQYMQAKLPQPCRKDAQAEPVNLNSSKVSMIKGHVRMQYNRKRKKKEGTRVTSKRTSERNT